MWFSMWVSFILGIRFSLFMNAMHKQEMVRNILNTCRMDCSVHLIIEIPLHWITLWWDFVWDGFHLQPLCPFWEIFSQSTCVEILVINHLILLKFWSIKQCPQICFQLPHLLGKLDHWMNFLRLCPLVGFPLSMSQGHSGGEVCKNTTWVSFLFFQTYKVASIYNSHKYSLHSHLATRNYQYLGCHKFGLRELQPCGRSAHTRNLLFSYVT